MGSLTFAIFLSAELGFLGVRVKILIQVPFLKGFCFKATLFILCLLTKRIRVEDNWLIVGIELLPPREKSSQ